MSDPADMADEYSAPILEAAIRANSKPIAPGTPGECPDCGEYTPRLVNGLCARCRDVAAEWVRRNGRVVESGD